MNKNIDISIIIPVFNEEQSLNDLHKEICNNIHSKYNWELIFINDGSNDKSKNNILKLISKYKNVKLIDFYRNHGKSEALNAGFHMSKGNTIITIDADLQDDPIEINKFISKIDDGYGMVSGWKKNRLDPFSKRFASKIFNFILRVISGIKLHDFNCGFKAYNSLAVKDIHLYGGLHRFIPIIIRNNGFSVTEVIVNHRMRKYGKSKYNSSRIFHGFFDFITLMFFNKYLMRPLHFFGIIGFILFLSGLLINLYITINWFNGYWITPYKNPMFFLGILLLIVGVQFFSIGLIGELIVKFQSKKNNLCSYYNFNE